jgi:diacylglycerol kinase family enzyme
MSTERVEVIATTISGSIQDWGKVKQIVPLFATHGRKEVTLHVVESHAEARETTRELVAAGARLLISAGGSGTFNRVLEGCIDSGVGLGEIRLGFLRKGSADLIGKTLGMPDEITEAIRVFAESLATDRTVPCDVIRVESAGGAEPPRHFVGYGGAAIFGRIPHYTENRFIKYYKGVLGSLFGDMGPFFVGTVLTVIERTAKGIVCRKTPWTVEIDGETVARRQYQALILANGYLGPDMPFARGVPLGSGDFHLFGLRDLGLYRLPGQFRHAWDGSVLEDPERWGFEHHRIAGELRLAPGDGRPFPVNVDGSIMPCQNAAVFRIADQIRLLSATWEDRSRSAPPPAHGPGPRD